MTNPCQSVRSPTEIEIEYYSVTQNAQNLYNEILQWNPDKKQNQKLIKLGETFMIVQVVPLEQ